MGLDILQLFSHEPVKVSVSVICREIYSVDGIQKREDCSPLMVVRLLVGEPLEERGVTHFEAAWLHFTPAVDIEVVTTELDNRFLDSLKG